MVHVLGCNTCFHYDYGFRHGSMLAGRHASIFVIQSTSARIVFTYDTVSKVQVSLKEDKHRPATGLE